MICLAKHACSALGKQGGCMRYPLFVVQCIRSDGTVCYSDSEWSYEVPKLDWQRVFSFLPMNDKPLFIRYKNGCIFIQYQFWEVTMTVLVNCPICDGSSSAMREHCPYCGARRNFQCSHSYQPYRVVVSYWNEQNSRELVRAYRCTVAADEQAILDSPVEE